MQTDSAVDGGCQGLGLHEPRAYHEPVPARVYPSRLDLGSRAAVPAAGPHGASRRDCLSGCVKVVERTLLAGAAYEKIVVRVDSSRIDHAGQYFDLFRPKATDHA